MRLLTGRENTEGGMGSVARKERTETISHGVHGLWEAWGYFRGDVNRCNRMSLCSSDKMTDEGQTKPNPRLETRHSKEQRYESVRVGVGGVQTSQKEQQDRQGSTDSSTSTKRTVKTGVRGHKIRGTETRGAAASNHSSNGNSTKMCSTDVKRDG